MDAFAELTIGHRAIEAYSRLSYTIWFALAEFVDNSTQSRVNYGNLIDDVLKEEGRPLTVSIVHNRIARSLSIEDNSIGMSKDDLIAALRIAEPTNDSRGRSKYGMGMKTAACWLGHRWTITTCEWDSGQEWTAVVDVDRIAASGAQVPLILKEVGKDQHYTKVTIGNLRRVIQKRSEETVKTYLGSIYMFDLKPDQEGHVGLKLTYDGEEIRPPQDYDWDVDPAGATMMRPLPELRIGEKTVNGWTGVLKKGGRKYGGFSLFQHGRQIQGFPAAWKPRAIFGGVDDEGANNLIAQRLTGVLQLDGFVLSHTKDAILFEDDEEDTLEQYLVVQTKDLAEYAKSRRSQTRTNPFSREQFKDLLRDLKSEFTSTEIKDVLSSAALPPPGSNNRFKQASL